MTAPAGSLCVRLASPQTGWRSLPVESLVHVLVDWTAARVERACKPLKMVVSAAGFEPATHALKGHCSTN